MNIDFIPALNGGFSIFLNKVLLNFTHLIIFYIVENMELVALTFCSSFFGSILK